MFKSSKGSPTKSSPTKTKASKSSMPNELTLLIARMQKNADEVERNILETQNKLKKDSENYKQKTSFVYQQENARCLKDSEILLKDLFLDVDKAKRLKHPQGPEIEKDIRNLHERLSQECSEYRDLYEKFSLPQVGPKVNWQQVLDQKQRELDQGQYGPGLPEVEKQVAEHNILQQQIEEYAPEIRSLSTGDADDVKRQYQGLLEVATWRGRHLSSLYNHLHGSTKELMYLNEQQNKVLRQDWSDQIADPASVRLEYENFKTQDLLTQEEYVNNLQDDGERMIELQHPAVNSIQAHQEALKTEWQNFLNLCICQEGHLKNVENYKKFQEDADVTSQSLRKLNSNLNKYNKDAPGGVSNLLLQLEKDEKTLQQVEKDVAELRKRSPEIAPLKQRRIRPSKPVMVDTVCDYDQGELQLFKGERYSLKDNSKTDTWVVESPDSGEKKVVPAACFIIAPPCSESMDRLKRLESELAEVKQKQAAVQNTLKSSQRETTKPNQLAPMGNATAGVVNGGLPDSQGAQLLNKLKDINGELEEAEQEILSHVRAPVNRSAPSEELTKRLKEQEGVGRRLQVIGSEKDAAQRECESYLSKKPSGPEALQIPTTMTNVKNKYNEVKSLSSLYDEEAKAALNLQKKMKIMDEALTGFETNLAHDGALPSSPNALQDRTAEIKAMKRTLVDRQDDLLKVNRSLKDTEMACSALQSNFQEYSPDLPRQRAEVQRLNDRYHGVADQLDQREKILRDTSLNYQQFTSSSNNLDTWLNGLPKNKVNPEDGPGQINFKLQSQKRQVDELQRKEHDKDTVVRLSQNVQSALNDYESHADRYRSTLDPALNASDAKRARISPLQESINAQEKDLVKRYTEATVESKQQLNQLEYAQKVLDKKDVHDGIQMDTMHSVQSENSLRSSRASDNLSSQLEEETMKVSQVQKVLEENRRTLLMLKTKRPIERLEEKEVVQYYRDATREKELASLKNQIESQYKQRESAQSEIDVVNRRISQLEGQKKTVELPLLTKEVTMIERDPNLESQASSLSKEIRQLKEENASLSTDLAQLKRELVILEQKQPNIKEKVVVKEVVKLERDPEMLKAARTLQIQTEDESFRRKTTEDNIKKLKSRIEELERVISNVEPKIIVKEVKKVEQDPEMLKEASRLKSLIEEEHTKCLTITRELTDIQSKYIIVEKKKPKVEIKEILNEVFHVDPETEREITRLKRELLETSSKRSNFEREIDMVLSQVNMLRSQKPAIEYKEIVQEVVKLEKSPENLREIERLKKQLSDLVTSSSRSQEQVVTFRSERDQWKRERAKIETQMVNKEVIKYEKDPALEKEVVYLREEVRNESQKRRELENSVYDLQNKCILLERRKPEEKVVIQEVVLLQKDPKLREDHIRLRRTLDEEVNKRRQMERTVQQLQIVVNEKEKQLNFQEERSKKLAAEQELRQITLRIKEIEESPTPVQEKIVMEEVVKIEKDPFLEKSANTLRQDLDSEKSKILSLERECKNLQITIDILQREKSIEKTVYKEIIRVEKDKVLENERARVRELYNKERNARQNVEDELRHIKEKLERAEGIKRSGSKEEADLQRSRNLALQERATLDQELRELGRQKQQKSVFLSKESQLLTQRTENDRQKKMQIEQELSSLEADILNEKDRIYEKERSIRDLQTKVNREELNHDTHMRETNVSTRISILDPDTGKDMSPYEAYRRGIIDRNQYIQLQELECDWEEISTMGSSGEISVLLDKKSGKQYSIEDALRTKKITHEELQMYRNGKLPISEFALLVAGETKTPSLSIGSIIGSKSPLSSPTSQQSQARGFFSQSSAKPSQDDHFPISGVYDTTTDRRFSIRNAMDRKLLDPDTAQKLLEAQAATGGIVDINTKERFSAHKALDKGHIDNRNMQKLLNAQKAFTGIEDPVTKKRLSLGEAVQKGLMPKENAIPYMEVQHVTGGLIDPKKTGRIPVQEAVEMGMVDSDMAKSIQDETRYDRNITDPITKDKISYKQAMARCQRDPMSGLLLLPTASDSFQMPLYRPKSSGLMYR
ncbi:envoplakin [Ambystoma mexicanum]|uniref:envoplakin n=1 Tax=Ambystoma mexicanum TaxID=8296 RepID=UPI0037E86F03